MPGTAKGAPEPVARDGRYLVLLRAVNVGGRALTAVRWKEALEQAGCRDVRTVGTTGNAVVRVRTDTPPARLEEAVEEALLAAAGLATDAFARDVPAWDGIVRGNPFHREGEDDPAHLVVTVLKAAPPPAAVNELRRSIEGRERVAPGDRHLYIVYPDGIGNSKLTATRIERVLGVRGTSRNWNTVRRLLDLARE